MITDIDKLRSLYIKYDTLSASGDDVVTDLRKEINNLELSVSRDSIIPQIAKLLYKEVSELSCNIDCNLQVLNGKIEYSFCTENSPLVRASVSDEDHFDLYQKNYGISLNTEILNNLSLVINRLSELTSEIESCKTETLKYLSKLQGSTSSSEKKILSSTDDENFLETQNCKILYCRSQNCDAKGKLLPNRDIIILKGSVLRTDVTPTYGPKDFREGILTRYCSLTDNGYIALRDLPPMSVSGASGLCLGRSSNGNVDWKDENGVRLTDLK